MLHKTTDWGIMVFVSLLFLMQACSISAPLITDVKSVDLKNTEKGTKGMEVAFRIKNPNAFALKVKRFDFEISINKKPIGKAYSVRKIKIAKHSEAYYPILLETDIDQAKTLLTGFGSLFQGKTEVAMTGSVKAVAGFLSKKFKAEVKAKINLKDFF
jgi:LEA14-like dessication related protein